MFYQLDVPTPSAKRFNKNKRFFIEAYSIGELVYCKEFIIPEDEHIVVFEWEDESERDEEVLDGNVYYIFKFEFRNETATRIETVKIELPPPLNEEPTKKTEMIFHDWEWCSRHEE